MDEEQTLDDIIENNRGNYDDVGREAYSLGKKVLQKKFDLAIQALQDFSEKGTFHDLHPLGNTHRMCGHFTLDGWGGNKSGFHEYIQNMDDFVRTKAREILKEIENN